MAALGRRRAVWLLAQLGMPYFESGELPLSRFIAFQVAIPAGTQRCGKVN